MNQSFRDIFSTFIETGDRAGPQGTEIVDMILNEGIQRNASDIHIRPYDAAIQILFRIDGILEEVLILPIHLKGEIIARIKILARIRLDDHVMPYDGRFKHQSQTVQVDIRVSMVPTQFGHNAVLRILGSKQEISLTSLGFSKTQSKLLEEAAQKEQGMIVVVGPTGSGKSTTLYSLLDLVDTKRKSVITIEDPIESTLENSIQMQVQEETGFTFEKGLRATFRQDPDVIMVGEMRDAETARIACNASLTGHLVFSTLHTKSSIDAIPRLIDMGIQQYAVASAIDLIISQRLLPLLCLMCRKETVPQIHEVVQLEKMHISEYRTFTANGCEDCSHKGYKGRIVISELLFITQTIRSCIVSKKQIHNMCVSGQNFYSMKSDVFEKCYQGLLDYRSIFLYEEIIT